MDEVNTEVRTVIGDLMLQVITLKVQLKQALDAVKRLTPADESPPPADAPTIQ